MKLCTRALPTHLAAIAALGVFAFVGCARGDARFADGAAFPQAATYARSGMLSSGSEHLAGVHFRFRAKCPHTGPEPRSWSETFSVRGAATGPYPGTFTATGGWDAFARLPSIEVWSFNESFTITSGSSQISGTISGGADVYPGPDGLHVVWPGGLAIRDGQRAR